MKNVPFGKFPLKKLAFLLLVIPFLLSCNLIPTPEPPGVGEKAELGYAALDPVIKGLEQYQANQGVYPETLDELVPDYLPSVPTEVNNESIQYTKTDESFSLVFHYIGPGMNTCTYTPESNWKCSGAY